MNKSELVYGEWYTARYIAKDEIHTGKFIKDIAFGDCLEIRLYGELMPIHIKYYEPNSFNKHFRHNTGTEISKNIFYAIYEYLFGKN